MEVQRITGKVDEGLGRSIDGLAKRLAAGGSRRDSLRILGGAIVAVAAGSAALEREAEAKRGRKRRKKKNRRRSNQGNTPDLPQNLPPGSPCETSSQCIPDYVCAVARNSSNSDTTCCGAQGAGCGAFDADSGEYTAPFCCAGYVCRFDRTGGTWTCDLD